MSPKQQRKFRGMRRHTRRVRPWSRMFREGIFNGDDLGKVRLRKLLHGVPGT